METSRADVALTARGLCPSRAQAQALIRSGLVTLNGHIVEKSSQPVAADDVLTVTGQSCPYVSRGGLKLEKALRAFGCDPAGLCCIDVGASTGGFTDVLLQNGAAHVYAVDVGEGQLAPSLLSDPRVTLMEHTNARYLRPDMFPAHPTLGVMDVSFISVRLILPALSGLLGEGGRLITLIKPQFEVGPSGVGKRGVVTSPKAHEEAIQGVMKAAQALGWAINHVDFSPITGQNGNIEFLADLTPGGKTVSPDEIRTAVKAAHESHRR